jgi:shikimate kinase
MSGKIFLVGMPGSGKSTLGRPLAEGLNLPFVDLDAEIEAKEQATIPSIFEAKGEVYFREVESELLKKWASSSDSFVLATGGGAPCFHHGMDIINASGISIFLDVALEELLARTFHDSNRPLLLSGDDIQAKEERIKNLYETRLPIYEQAHISLENASVEDALHIITTLLNP